ncbi:hypothetical protein DFH08DRAFT_1033964 [Mycena albidolilacea]|uniref:Uncharacterized protein n=1 Tax=Mycena albidolilacea TaxID=1033008 RepID=A0AAD7EFY7_9AGAR|nr:hypothetical protein DFH08DRAFT_1033964 [Mycena albidolilacea]
MQHEDGIEFGATSITYQQPNNECPKTRGYTGRARGLSTGLKSRRVPAPAHTRGYKPAGVPATRVHPYVPVQGHLVDTMDFLQTLAEAYCPRNSRIPPSGEVTDQISASHHLMPWFVSYRYFRQLPSMFPANEPMLSGSSEARRLQNPLEDQDLAFTGYVG